MRGKTTEALTARVLNGMAEVPPVIWDGLANPPGGPVNPFVSHAFAHVDLGQVGLLRVGNPKGTMTH